MKKIGMSSLLVIGLATTVPLISQAESLYIINDSGTSIKFNDVVIPNNSTSQAITINENEDQVKDLGSFDINGHLSSSIYVDGPSKNTNGGHASFKIYYHKPGDAHGYGVAYGDRSTSVSNNPQALSIDQQIYMAADIEIDSVQIYPQVLAEKNDDNGNDKIVTPLSAYSTIAVSWPQTHGLYNFIQPESGSLTTTWKHSYTYTSTISFTGSATDLSRDQAGSLQGETFDANGTSSAPIIYQWWVVDKNLPFTPKSFDGNIPQSAVNGDYLLVVKSANSNQSDIESAFVFGDSLSDRNNLFDQSNGMTPRGAYYNGRFSNGPNWVDDFEQLTGIPTYDYAFGGAEVLPVQEDYGNLHTFNNGSGGHYSDIVYGSYEAGSNHAPNIPDLMDELDAASLNMQEQVATGKQIALIVYMGGNDYKHLVDHYGTNPDSTTVQQYTEQVAKTLIQDITSTMATLSTFGPTPLLVYTELGDPAATPVFSKRTSAQEFADDLNADVETLLKNSPINYVINRAATTTDTMISNPTSYGLVSTAGTYPTTDCLWGNADTKGNYNSLNTAGYMYSQFTHNSSLTPLKEYSKLEVALNYNKSNVGKTLFSGYLHPSAKANALMAYQFIYNLSQSGYIDLSKYSNDPIMTDISSSKGITNPFLNTSSFNDLIDDSDNQSEKRPDWAQGYLK